MTSLASSTPLPIPLLDGEQMLLQSSCRYLLTTPAGWGYNPISGTLWLTNQRIVFKPGMAVTRVQSITVAASGARVTWFPIKRVSEASEESMRVQWLKSNILKIQFDNGGREYFDMVSGKAVPAGTWAAAISKACADAAELPYDAVPALKPGFEQPPGRGAQRMLLYWVLGLVVLCVVCSVVSLVLTGTGIVK